MTDSTGKYYAENSSTDRHHHSHLVLVESFKGLPNDKRRPYLWRTAFWSVLALSLALVATGRMHWLGAGLAALVPLIKGALILGMRALPFSPGAQPF